MDRVKIQVHDGKLIGIVKEAVNGERYVSFQGIPYAKPPIGSLRFKDPVSPEPWSGDRDASKYGNIAVQVDLITHEVIGDEDCLYLNVYTTDIKPSKKRPVMVWIHGGGFYAGSGNSTWYGPDYIVQKDVILVTLNYRLGVLGFLNLNDEVATGNQGLKDVVMALQWVQKNITEFGGDAGNVTIFGESAGGAIVHYLAISPLAEGLFHKVIAQSGVITCPWSFNEMSHSRNNGFRLTETLGKATDDPKVACDFLLTIDAKKLIETQHTFISPQEYLTFDRIKFTPSTDYASLKPFFPKHPKEDVCRGVKVPLLLGFTKDEGIFFVKTNFIGHISNEALKEIDIDFKKIMSPKILCTLPQIPITLSELRLLYFNNKAVSEETLMNYANFLGDLFFYRGIMETVNIQINSNNHSTTFLYHFAYNSPTSLAKKLLDIKLDGVCHTEDLFFLFYPEIIKDLGILPQSHESPDYKMINNITQMWTDFAKTGNPTPDTKLWKPLSGGDYNYLNINCESEMKIFHKGEQRWDWENIRKKL